MSKIVLIAEDVADVRTMMEFLIQMHGFETVLAANGEEAVELAEKHRPDLILMDLMMPTMDGFTAARAIKENNELSKIPIVAVTAFGDDCHDRAVAAGIDRVIAKPIDFEDLAPLLDQYLSR